MVGNYSRQSLFSFLTTTDAMANTTNFILAGTTNRLDGNEAGCHHNSPGGQSLEGSLS
jgi:hypothetical protein